MTMPVPFHIPGCASSLAGGAEVEIGGSPNTGESVVSLVVDLPDRMTTEQGDIREHINVFIGDKNVRYTGGLTSVFLTVQRSRFSLR